MQRMQAKFRSGMDSMGAAAVQTATAMSAAIAASIAGFSAVESAVIKTSAEFENYNIRLNHVLGSVTEGNRLFQDMTKFASTVPFAFNDVMGAATQLSGVMQGGVTEVNKWMPMIADLAAVSGLSIRETTDQVVRMYSAGAASADLFRERGILAMLGFQAGVSVSAEDTRKQLIAAFEDPASKFRGAANDLATTWDGTMSMMGDKWTLFKKDIGDAGAFDAAKNVLHALLGEINDNGDAVKALATEISNGLMTAMEGGITGIAMFAKGFSYVNAGADVARLAIDSVALTVLQLADSYYAVSQAMKEFTLSMHAGRTGLADEIKTIAATRKELGLLIEGVKQTGADSLDAVMGSGAAIDAKGKQIDVLAQKAVNAIEQARSAAAAAANTPNDTSGHSAAPTAMLSMPSAADKKALKKAETEREQLAQLAIEKQRTESLDRISIRQEEINRLQQMGQISGLEAIQAQKALDDKIMQVELKAAREHAALMKNKPVEYQKALNQIEAIQRKHDLTMAQMQTKTALEQKKQWDKMFAPVTQAFEKSVNGMIQGTLTFRKAMQQMGQSILLEFANMGVKMVVSWVKNEAMKTAATAAGTATRGGIEASGAAMSLMTSAGTAVKEIMMNAWKVMANVYNAIAAIPFVGPFLAPVAAAGAFAVVAGYASNIASASGGYDIPAGVNPMTQLHQQEMVLPAHIANPLRDMVAGGGQAGGSSTVVIQAMDARSFQQYLTRNANSLPPALKKLKRNFSA